MKKFYFPRKAIFTTILSAGVLAAAGQSTTFTYTGSLQSYTVPAGVTTIGVTAFGAQGGNQSNDPAYGGTGAQMYGEFNVVPGHVLSILVGQQPASGIYTGGGGGGSFVWDITAGNVLLIAAGGGGGAGFGTTSTAGIDAVTTNDGTNGGGMIFGGAGTGGNGGTAPTGTCNSTYGAGGAGWLSGGAAGNGGFCSVAGGGFTPLAGGAGGASGGSPTTNGSGGYGGGGGSQGQCSYSGGGGGGGYSGGGGGDYSCLPDGAEPGGGGGSYNIGFNQSNNVGNTGNGVVTICAFPAPGTITGLTSFCVGSATTVADSAGVTGGTWMSSDNSIATVGSSTGTVTGVSTGSVTITYLTPANGCGTAFAVATVTVNPMAVISGGANVAVCSGSSTTLNATGGVSYSWSPSTGLDCPTCPSPTATPGSTTTYSVTGIDTNGCSATATVTVSVNPLPVAYNVTESNSGRYCAGGAGVHIGVDTTDLGVSYQLYYGMTAIGSAMPGTDTSLDFGLDTAAGTYTVIATDTATGCVNVMNGSADVVIVPVVVPSVSLSTLPYTTVCAGTAVTFGATPTNGGSMPMYHWFVNGTSVGTDSVGYGYTPSDGDQVSVLLMSSQECAIPDSAYDTVTMTVLPYGIAAVSVTANPGDSICEGSPVTITAHPTYGGTSPFYVWIKNGAIVDTGVTYTYIPSDSDQVIVNMLSTYLCPVTLLDLVAYSGALTLRTQVPEIPSVTISGRPGMYIGSGRPDTLVATVSNGGPSVSYQWYLNGIAVGGATSSTWVRSAFVSGDSVSCLVTRNDACGLSTINSVVVHVGVGVPLVSANGDLALVPNPNNGTFYVKGKLNILSDGQVTAEVVNMVGQVVYRKDFAVTNGDVNEQIQLGSDIANGTYILNLRSQQGSNVFHFVVGR